MAGPGPCLGFSAVAVLAAGGRESWAPPHPPTYRAGAPAPRVREMGLRRTHFWELWPLRLGAGERILWGGWKEGSGEDPEPRRSKGRRKERPERAPAVLRVRSWCEQPRPGFLRPRPRAALRRPCSGAHSQGISREKPPDWAEGGELRVAQRGADARL